VNNLSRK